MPGMSDDAMNEKIEKKTLALEEGNITFVLIRTPTILTNTDTSQKCLILSPSFYGPRRHVFSMGLD